MREFSDSTSPFEAKLQPTSIITEPSALAMWASASAFDKQPGAATAIKLNTHRASAGCLITIAPGKDTVGCGAKTRAQLAKESPILYKAAKLSDQTEIDRVYGLKEFGQSKFIRAFDGSMIDNNEEDRLAVAKLEKH